MKYRRKDDGFTGFQFASLGHHHASQGVHNMLYILASDFALLSPSRPLLTLQICDHQLETLEAVIHRLWSTPRERI